MPTPKGKHVRIDPENPDAIGFCDKTGFPFNYSDLVKQMEWRGNELVWTGALVGKPYVDEPTQVFRPPIFKQDPEPVINPRCGIFANENEQIIENNENIWD